MPNFLKWAQLIKKQLYQENSKKLVLTKRKTKKNMKKKTFMVEQVHLDTLTAAALAIGFIACSDEDDNHDVHSNNLSPPQWRLNGNR